MIRLSVNVLTSAIALFERLDTYHNLSLSDISYSKIASINTDDIITFTNSCGWVDVVDDIPQLTPRGTALLKLHKQGLDSKLKSEMLLDYVLHIAPIWTNLIPRGRREAMIFMSKDECACFIDAGLLSETPTLDIVNWWDMVAGYVRSKVQQNKTDTGRSGERYTMDYERSRTKSEPKWMSVDTNTVGYDIQSRKSEDDATTLLIEVKTSQLAQEKADFHITSNEWRVASTSEGYLFYLWCLFGGKRMLAIVTPQEVQPYVPTNNLEGEWESTKIPFSCFAEKFSNID